MLAKIGVTVTTNSKKMGIYKRKDPNGHFVAYKAFRDDPQANPLKHLPVD
ncbi:hypothetical protein ACVXG9_00845 [Escherichia coli]